MIKNINACMSNRKPIRKSDKIIDNYLIRKWLNHNKKKLQLQAEIDN